MTNPPIINHDSYAKENIERLISRWETDVVLSDGGTVKIRPIVPNDAPLIERLHASLSAETIYFRFFSPVKKLSDTMLHRFVNVDYSDRMAFVAIFREEIIAVSRYERLPGRSEAEVAFLVSDAHQGRGLGSIMLEMLAARASEAGITRFIAETLPENQKMLRVFHGAGYKDSRSYQDGVVRVVFDIEPTAESVEKMQERERTAVARSIGKILSPRSIAVVGASTTSGSVGNVIFRNILESSFSGTVYPVNQHAGSVSSVKAYPSLKDIPDEIDLAVIVVPANEVLSVVDQAADKGVSGLVIISSGFSETGAEGTIKERELVRFARQNGMRIVGPNCMGVANTDPRISLNATLGPHGLLPGRASLIAHSGALGLAIVEEARRRGIGLANFVSSGNRADVSGNDLMHYWEQDDTTDVVLLYLESFGNPRSFVRIARRLSKNKPIVAVKAKRVATVPPTMSIFRVAEAGQDQPVPAAPEGVLGIPQLKESNPQIESISADEAVDAMFAHTGVLRVNSLSELFSLGHALETQPPPRGPNVVILSNTGGPASIAQDSIERAGLKLATLTPETVDYLEKNLPQGAKTTNPVELPANADAKFYENALKAIISDPNTDSVLTLYVPTVTWRKPSTEAISGPLLPFGMTPSTDASVANATEVALRITKVSGSQDRAEAKTVLANFLALPSTIPALKKDGYEVPLFAFPELAAQALGRMWEYYQWKLKPNGEFLVHAGIDRAAAGSAIADYLGNAEEIPNGARLKYPISREVYLDTVQSLNLLGLYDIHGVGKIEKTNENGDPLTAEIKLSVVHDMVFGPFVTMQLGGLLADLLDSKATRVLPLRDLDARELLASIPGSKIFNGYRTVPRLDVGALIDLLSKLGQFVENHFAIANMSLNPIILGAHGYNIETAQIRLVDWAAQANYLMRGLS
ncbi:MAG: GNAT family N-acetyltransferase [Actinomycetota bacterium]|nr:MAG: GNAT family N-acetyltransferase [Actinomycetota bacterium]